MALYPNILFHLTKKRGLYNILNHTFKISYARERILGEDQTKEFGVPMVSFSDLRLSELKEHIGTYGKFGIGLTKDWAIKEGLNPVMYTSRHSLFTKNFFDGVESYFRIVNSSETYNSDNITAYNKTLNVLRYIKNYKGDLIRPRRKIKHNFVFANEREWRFVPPFSEQFPSFVPIELIETSEMKARLNQQIDFLRLRFNPDDIQYLIVEKDKDINSLISHLRIAKVGFSDEIVDRLTSRILTFEQIKKDV